jgi:hypothetical protein
MAATLLAAGFLGAALPMAGCRGRDDGSGGDTAGALGTMQARLVTTGETPVAAVRVEVQQGGRVVETRDLTVGSISLPGMTPRRGGDAYFALVPGAYVASATALDEAGAPIAACIRATASARVVAGQTSEVMLAIFCGTAGTGGLDTVITVTNGPTIRDLTFDPSKLTTTCEGVTVTVNAATASGDPLEYAWAVVAAPPKARYRLVPHDASATFTAETEGSFGLHVSVTDPAGHATTLAFPIHVGAGPVRQCVRRPQSLDTRFGEIARRVPEFGGAYVGANGELRLVLTDTSDAVAVAAEAAVRDIIGADRPLPQGPVAVDKGQYGFDHLMANRVRSRPVMALAGVVSLGVDERQNRVKIGVVDDAARRSVQRELLRLGVNTDAVLIQTTQPIGNLANTDMIRPVVGGTQIALSGGGTCTLGFVASRKGKRGYLTNSHCTNIQGGNEATTHAQAGGSDTIGTEIADPMYFTGGDCPDDRRCRWSDSSFGKMDAGITNQRGDIYKTSLSRYRVVVEVDYPLGGEHVRKMGRTTGESSGEVIDTCCDSNVKDSDITQLCQDYVEAASMKGDSGSPVFMNWSPTPGAENPVAAMGLLWGGPDDGSYFVFSAFWNIEEDLENVSVTFKDSAPTIAIVKPVSGQKVNFGGFNDTLFEAVTDDMEGGPDCCDVTWISNVDGALGTGKSLSYVFGSAGIRTITATATDAFGNQTSDSVTVSTENIPPVVNIVKPTSGQQLWQGLPYTFNGWAWDSEIFSDLPCSAMTWTSSNLGDPFPALGCTPQVTFLTAGGRTATLTAVDGNGGTGKANRFFTVAVPAGGGPPIVSILKPFDNQFFDAQQTVILSGTAQDTDNPSSTLTYKWILNPGTAGAKVLHTATGPSGGQSTFQWHPTNDVVPNCGGGTEVIGLEVTDPEGTASESVSIYIFFPVC